MNIDPTNEKYDLESTAHPSTFYVIASIPRSGSTLLCTALWKTDLAGYPHEYFHKRKHMPILKERWGVNYFQEYIKTLLKKRTSLNGVFGFKAHFDQFNNSFKEKDIDLIFPDLKYIYITRNNILKQAISLTRAIQTNRWNYEQQELQKPIFNFRQIEENIDRIKKEETQWEQYFYKSNVNPFRIAYEGLLLHYDSHIKNIIKFLGINIHDKLEIRSIPMKKQSDKLNDEWLNKYLSEKKSKPFIILDNKKKFNDTKALKINTSFAGNTQGNMKLAPIGLSTYSRLTHLRQTIEALKANTLAKESKLFIFSDAPKPGDESKVNAVRKYLDTINGFRNIQIFKREKNSRVRNNRDGISELLDKYGKCIYLEEDIVTAPNFLKFMNESLNVYEKDDKIFSISGYSPPLIIPDDYIFDVFILRRACAWGMGIWRDRYRKILYLDNAEVRNRFSNHKEVEELSKHGEDLLHKILLEAAGKLDALDVKIFYYQYLNEKYTIYPRKSLVRNIGFDGSGLHCGKTDQFDTDLWDKSEFKIFCGVRMDDRIVRANQRFRKNKNSNNSNGRTDFLKKKEMSAANSLGGRIIFLISQPRAGSTLLQRILSGHPDIHTTAEPWIMLHPLYALKKAGVLAEYDFNLARQGLEDFTAQVPEGIALYIDALRQMGCKIYNRVLEVVGKPLFLDKTPRYYLIIPELKRVFPKAKFIILLRNPMAVLSSTLKTWFHNDPESLKASPNYKDVMQGPQYLIEGIRFLKEDAIVVRYEELVEDTEMTIKAICHKLGIAFQHEMLAYGGRPKPKGRFGDVIGIVKHDNAVPYYIDKWITNLKSAELYEFSLNYIKALGPDIFDVMGYPYHENKNKLEGSENPSCHKENQTDNASQKQIVSSKNPQTVEDRIKILETNLENNPHSAQSHNDLGVLYYQSGLKEKVLNHYQEAVRLNPHNTVFLKNLADFYYVELKNVIEALQIYNDILEIEPKDAETLQILGFICEDLQKYEDAKDFYTQVLAIEPHNHQARHRLDKLGTDDSGDRISAKMQSRSTLNTRPNQQIRT